MTSALDTVGDPLLTPLLALLKDAITSDLAAGADPDATPEAAVATTAPHPVPIEIAGESALPLLAVYRVRSRVRHRTLVLVDHTYTLQFAYVSPATSREQIAARWPLLERVWRSLLAALCDGRHAAHEAGADVFSPLGVIEVSLPTAQKREIFYEGGDFAYPAFVAELEVVVQDTSALDTGTLYPALSFESDIYVGDVTAEEPADVRVISYTPLGEAVRDGLITEEDLAPSP